MHVACLLYQGEGDATPREVTGTLSLPRDGASREPTDLDLSPVSIVSGSHLGPDDRVSKVASTGSRLVLSEDCYGIMCGECCRSLLSGVANVVSYSTVNLEKILLACRPVCLGVFGIS